MTICAPRRTAILTIATMIAAVAVLTVAASSRAATFTVYSCHDPAGNAVGTAGWQASHSSGFFITTNLSCASSTDQMSIATGPNGAGYSESQGGFLSFVPPSPVTISSFSLDATSAYADPCTADCSIYGSGDVWINNSTIQDPVYNYRDLGGGQQYPGVISSSPGDATWVGVAADCDDSDQAGRICTPNDPTANISVYSGVFKLFDSSTPQVSNVSGPLIAGGSLSGTQAIHFNASDNGSGIYSAIVDIDGKRLEEPVLDSNNGLCVNLGQTNDGTRAFAGPQPCETTVAATVNVDTTQLSGGTHHLQVFVDDAAGDQTPVYDGTITVNNPPSNTTAPTLADTTTATGAPQIGDVLKITPGVWTPASTTTTYSWQICSGDGSSCHALPGQSRARLTIQPGYAGDILIGVVNATDSGGSRQLQAGVTDDVAEPARTINGQPVAGAANGTPCPDPALTTKVNGKHRGATVHFPAGAIVTGYLGCTSTPIPDASLVVNGDGRTTSVKTNASGEFTFVVARRGPSRSLKFSYTAYSQDVAPAATATALLSVIPTITLSITPRATRNDGWMTWHGRIRGGPYPAQGVALLAQVKELTWHTFAQIVSNANGKFTYRYHFTHTFQATTYAFRVTLPHNGAGGYSYAPASSRTIRVPVS